MKSFINKPCCRALFFAALSFFFAESSLAQSLREAISAAEAQDPALQSASANRAAAENNIDISLSRLLPQLNYQYAQQRITQDRTEQTSLGPNTSHFQGPSSNKQLSLRQGLIRPRDVEGYFQSKYQYEYGDQKYLSAKSDLWVRVIGGWLDLIAARELTDAYQDILKSVEKLAKQESRRFEQGDSTRDSKAEALAQLEQAKAQHLDADFNLKARERLFYSLSSISHTAVSARRLPPDASSALQADSYDQLWQKFLDSGPDLQAALMSEKVNLSRVTQASYDQLPTLDFVATAAMGNNDQTNTLGYVYNYRQWGVVLQVPLFAGGGLDATQKQARNSYLASVSDKETLIQRAQQQFDADWASQLGMKERVAAAESLVSSAKLQRHAAERGLVTGLRTWSDLGNADLLLARRYSDLVALKLALYKTQLRILSLTPTSSPEWEKFVHQLEAATLNQKSMQ